MITPMDDELARLQHADRLALANQLARIALLPRSNRTVLARVIAGLRRWRASIVPIVRRAPTWQAQPAPGETD